ncbi:MAG: fused MFS/spermidine synthase [Acidobacteriota bacterium]
MPEDHTGSVALKRLLAPFLLGFIALSIQVFFLREFSVYFFGNEFSFGICLGAWLFWVGMGSFLGYKVTTSSSLLPSSYLFLFLIIPLCFIALRCTRFFFGLHPGETTGFVSMLFTSLILCFFLCFPLGLLFVWNVRFFSGKIEYVYLLEAAGSVVGGITAYFLLVPFFSNWMGVTLSGIAVTGAVFFSFGEKKGGGLALVIAAFLIIFGSLDVSLEKAYWSPFSLSTTKDTIYGKLQIIETEGQISLYDNHLIVYSYPDLASAEESVHFALLQKPLAQKILLIGGGLGGSLEQILKYPLTEIDYVELDPGLIRLSRMYLPAKEIEALENPRVKVHYRDGRTYLQETEKYFDIIIVNLPDPVTLQLNRFYSLEFFRLAQEKMNPDGIFSFRVTSAENYISPERLKFLSSLNNTLKMVFPQVEVVPGGNNIFLGSSSKLSLDINILANRIREFDLNNTYVSPSILFSRLEPFRINSLKRNLASQTAPVINKDFIPVSYYFTFLLWSKQFRYFDATLLNFFLDKGKFWLLNFPLLVFSLLLIFWILRKKRTVYYLTPLTIMGLSSIVLEIIIILAFQVRFGYLYQRLALLFSAYMLGLFLGALSGKRAKGSGRKRLILLQLSFTILIGLMSFCLGSALNEPAYFMLLLVLGFLGGELFITANRLYLGQRKHYGLGYGLDLMGSFLGAVGASSLIIPLFGIPVVLGYIFLLNFLCLVFIFFGLQRK